MSFQSWGEQKVLSTPGGGIMPHNEKYVYFMGGVLSTPGSGIVPYNEKHGCNRFKYCTNTEINIGRIGTMHMSRKKLAQRWPNVYAHFISTNTMHVGNTYGMVRDVDRLR